MKKTKILIIFLIAFVITALNLISIHISNTSFINHNIKNQEMLLKEQTKDGPHILLYANHLHQTGPNEAKAKVNISDTHSSKDKLLGLYVFSKISYDKFIEKKMDVKEGTSEFGLKHVTINGMIQGEQDILFTAKYMDSDSGQIEYIGD